MSLSPLATPDAWDRGEQLEHGLLEQAGFAGMNGNDLEYARQRAC